MQPLTELTVREIALAAPATTRVFEEYKIDYCCGGRRSIEDACLSAGIDKGVLTGRLAAVIEKATSAENAPEGLPASELVDYILAKHHLFTWEELHRLAGLMSKVVMRHGDLHPELLILSEAFTGLKESLLLHMRKEENVLFPYIKGLAAATNVGTPHFGTVANPIRMMEADHDTDGERLRRMREITSDYALPEGACPTFTALYAGLEDLERDLHQHIHLENNILFPAALAIEAQA